MYCQSLLYYIALQFASHSNIGTTHIRLGKRPSTRVFQPPVNYINVNTNKKGLVPS